MKIKMKKIIASILTLMMIFTQVPISSAVYANSGTEITEGGTYQIRGNSINIDDYENYFYTINSSEDVTIEFMNDVYIYSLNKKEHVNPIFYNKGTGKLTIKGNGHKVESNVAVSFFQQLGSDCNSSIENLKIDFTKPKGDGYSSLKVISNWYGEMEIKDCTINANFGAKLYKTDCAINNNGSLKMSNTTVNGIICNEYEANTYIDNCIIRNNAETTSDYLKAGIYISYKNYNLTVKDSSIEGSVYGIYDESSNSKINIEGNSTFNGSDSGIYFKKPGSITFDEKFNNDISIRVDNTILEKSNHKYQFAYCKTVANTSRLLEKVISATDDYVVVSENSYLYLIRHAHSWEYESNNDSISAKCITTENTCSYNTNPIALKVNVTDSNYTGEAYNGLSLKDINDQDITNNKFPVTKDDITVEYEGENYPRSQTAPCNVGKYKVYVTTGGKTVVKDFKINKVASSLTTAVKAKDLTYNGQEQELVTAGKANGGTIYYKLNQNDEWSTFIPKGKEAGKYQVYYYIKGDENHNDDMNADGYKGIVEVEIQKSNSNVSIEYAKNLTYNGKNQALITKASSSDGTTLKYKLNDGEWSTQIPSVKDAGEYTVFYKVEGGNNYKDTDEISKKILIEQKEAQLEWSNLEFIYDGKDHVPTATVTNMVDHDECKVTISNKQTDVGTYTATATKLSNPNYKLSEQKTIEYKINKANRNAPTTVTTIGTTYKGGKDGQLNNVDKTMEYQKDGETKWHSITGNTVKELSAGDYFVRYKENENYNASKVQKVRISNGKEIKVIVPTTQVGYTLSVDKEIVDYNESCTLTFAFKKGYGSSSRFAIKVNGQKIQLNKENQYTINNIQEDVEITVEGVIDQVSPKVQIEIGKNKWDYFNRKITYGNYFFNNSQATIIASDNESGVDKIYYYVDTSGKDYDFSTATNVDIEKLATWKEDSLNEDGSYTISLNKYDKCVIFVKVVDKTGNRTYINTDGLTIDSTAPQVSGVKSNQTYTKSKYFTVIEENLDTVKVDGKEVTPVDGQYSLVPKDGTYTIEVTDKAGNQTTLDDIKVNWEEVKKPTVESKVYTGEQLTADIFDGDLYTVIENKGGIDVGEYDVKLSLKDPINYKWEDDKDTIKFRITKAIPTLTKPTTKDLTYDGNEQKLVNEASTNGGVIKYSLDNKNWSTSIPTGKDAKEYKVYYKVEEDKNYKGIDVQEITNKINPKTIDLQWDNELTYNGKNQLPKATATNLITDDECNIVVEGANKNAGTYKATATKVDNSNFKLPKNVTTEYTINKKQISVEDLEAVNRKYNGTCEVTLKGGKLIGIVKDDKVSIEMPMIGTIENPNAGENKTVNYVKTVLKGEDKDNYELLETAWPTLTVIISRSDQSNTKITTTDDELNKEYDGQGPVDIKSISNSTSTPIIEYSLKGKNEYTTTKPKDAGEYTVRVTYPADVNYEESSDTKDFTITPKKLDVIVATVTKEYDGTKDAVVIGTVETGIEGEMLSINGLKGIFNSEDVKVANKVVVDHSKVEVKGNDSTNVNNYKLIYPETVDGKVTPRELDIKWSNTELIYNGKNQKPKATATNVIAGDECNITVDSANKNAGTYDAKATEVSNSNYKLPKTVNTKYIIKPKDITVTITANGGIYGEKINGATVKLNGVEKGDDPKVILIYTGKANDGTEVNGIEVPSHAGKYIVAANVNDPNYNLTGTTSAQFVVKAAGANLNVTKPSDKNYNDEAFKLEVSHKGNGELSYESSNKDVATVDDQGNVTIHNAGTTTLKVSLIADGNYNADNKEITLNVNKINHDLMVEKNIEKTYGDAPFTISAQSKDQESAIEYTSSNEKVATIDHNGNVTIIGVGKAKITVSQKESKNYNAVSQEVDLVVKAKKITVTADDKEKVYQDKDEILTYSHDQLVGNDILENITLSRIEGEDVGTYKIKVSQKEGSNPNYDITFKDGTYTINPLSIDKGTVVLGNVLKYTGEKQTQEVEQVLVNGKALNKEDYEVLDNQATKEGKHVLTIKAKGNNHTGSFKYSYAILPKENDKIGTGSFTVKTTGDVEISRDEVIDLLIENKEITANELSEVAEGKKIEIVLEVKEAQTNELIETNTKGYKVGKYLNITLNKIVNGTSESIHELTKKLKISIELPTELINKDKTITRTYFIARSHNGKVDILETKYDEKTNSLTFETDKFSDYAIIYKDKKELKTTVTTSINKSNTKQTTKAKTGDNANIIGLMMLLVSSMFVMVFVRKKEN